MEVLKCIFCCQSVNSTCGVNIKNPDRNGISVLDKVKCCLGTTASSAISSSDLMCTKCLINFETFDSFSQTCVKSEAILKADWQKRDSATTKQVKKKCQSKLDDQVSNHCADNDIAGEDSSTGEVSSAGEVSSRRSDGKKRKTTAARNFKNQNEDFRYGNGITDREALKTLVSSYISCSNEDEKLKAESYSLYRAATKDRSGPFRCRICDKTFTSKCSCRTHMMIHTEKPFSCTICNNKFRYRLSLESHVLTHLNIKPYSCSVCGRSFRTKSSCDSHQWRHTGVKKYSCKVCLKSFVNLGTLKYHAPCFTQNPLTCNICEKMCVEKGTLKRHIETHSSDKPFHCGVCQKVFRKKPNLMIHMRYHTKERPYSCSLCDKSFIQSHDRKLHMIKVHLKKEGSYKCIECNKTFLERYRLNNHKKDVHSRTRNYACDICTAAFKTSRNLERHRKMVHRKLSVSCNVCGKCFCHKRLLSFHLEIHSDSWERYFCDICGSSFLKKDYLCTHMNIHTCNCNFCGRTFSRKNVLEQHMKIHLEKPICTNECVESHLIKSGH